MDIREYGGYIKLYRSLKLWEWYKNPATLTLWINLLLSVNREETRYMGKVIPAGSIVTSYRKLSEETGLSVKAVRVALKHLKETNEVAHQTASKYSVITIVKWADFQASESDMGTVKGTMKGKQRASRGQAEGKLIYTRK